MTEAGINMLDLDEDTEKDRFLTFLLGNESYCIEINHIIEIIGIQPITQIPELPSFMKGIVNLRGKIIPVIDVRDRLKKPTVEYTSRTCIIIVEICAVFVGLIVATVAEVVTIPESEISLSVDISRSKYIRGIGKLKSEVKLILDCNTLLSNDSLEELSHI